MKMMLLFVISALTSFRCYSALTEWGTFRAVYVAETDSYQILCVDEIYDVGMLVTGAGFSSRLEFEHGMKRITFNNLTSLGVPQTWIVASAGERISANTLNGLENRQCLLRMEEDIFIVETAGPATIELAPNADMYLAFVCRDDPYFAGDFYYGWIKFNGNNVLDYNYDVGDGEMVVGGGAWEGNIPEPSGGILLLLGAAVLGLRRRTTRPILLYSTHVRQNNNHGAPGGPHTARFSTEIQAALDALSDAAAMPRHSLQFFDFSSFTELSIGGYQ